MGEKIISAVLFFSLFITISKGQNVLHTNPNANSDQIENLFRRHSTFKPRVNVSIGYGYPNVDQNYLPRYEYMFHRDISQTGPFMAAVDYQFSRRLSIGMMITRGIVSTPYYDYSSQTPLTFTAKFFNWSCMVDIVRYIPLDQKIFPYVRTAIGINFWKQDYTDIDGSKASVKPVTLPVLAYQAGIGAKFMVLKNAGIFIEAGYGKYVFDAGLSVKL